MADSSKIVTRFAPSPTGFLHLGSARTALFNWLYARRLGGQFLLRIEDTDRARSTQEAIDVILEGMTWLGLDWDGDVVYQSSRASRHSEIAKQLIDIGHAYYCYATPQELEEMRRIAESEKRSPKYDGRWRDRDPSEAPEGVKPVVRLKATQTGSTTIKDAIQGEVTINNEQLDDMVLLRADGTPTYMLSVVVDDHDMGVTQIIRGDDHLTNTFRQNEIYKALGWQAPEVAHIPLIHGPDGAKLSKRHGALGINAYEEMGILPEAMCNYLLRLGWSHGDDEIISRDQAVSWFNLQSVGKSPARFDMDKLRHLNGHYIREAAPKRLLDLIEKELENYTKRSLQEEEKARILKGMKGLQERAKDLHELAELAQIYCDFSLLAFDEKAQKHLGEAEKVLLRQLLPTLEVVTLWQADVLEADLRAYAQAQEIKFGQLAMPLRAGLTGRAISPGVFDVLEVLGQEESLSRLRVVIK